MGVKGKIEDKALDVSNQLAMQAQAQFVQKVMKWENCSYEHALDLCAGTADPPDPGYSLGYKMADPTWQLAMFGQARAKKRQDAIANFEDLLTPEELIKFREEVLPMSPGKRFKAALRKKGKQ